jgi:hypothetical protein
VPPPLGVLEVRPFTLRMDGQGVQVAHAKW